VRRDRPYQNIKFFSFFFVFPFHAKKKEEKRKKKGGKRNERATRGRRQLVLTNSTVMPASRSG